MHICASNICRRGTLFDCVNNTCILDHAELAHTFASICVQTRVLKVAAAIQVDFPRGGGGGGRTRVLEQGLDRFYKFVRADIVGSRVVAQLTPVP